MRVIGQASPAVGREPFELVGSLRWLPGDIPPVHVVDQSGPFACPCQVIRPGASPAGGTVANPTADIPGTATPCLKDPIETLPRVSNDRAGSTGTGSSSSAGFWAYSDDSRHLDRLPLNQARPGGSCHSGPNYPAPDRRHGADDRERPGPLLSGSRLELDHQLGRHPSAVLHVDSLRLSPLAHLGAVHPARRRPAPAPGRPPGTASGPPGSLT